MRKRNIGPLPMSSVAVFPVLVATMLLRMALMIALLRMEIIQSPRQAVMFLGSVGSSDLLAQVWQDLIGNAIKFTADGESICILLRKAQGRGR